VTSNELFDGYDRFIVDFGWSGFHFSLPPALSLPHILHEFVASFSILDQEELPDCHPLMEMHDSVVGVT
jgi:hypothetical protein